MGHRHLQAEKDPAPTVLGQLVHRLSPRSLSLHGHFLMAEAIRGRCPRLERFEFGLLNRRPSFRAPDWVSSNFRSFSLRGKGHEDGHTGFAQDQTVPAALPPCHVMGPCPSPSEDRPARATPAGVALCPGKYDLLGVGIRWHGLCNRSEQDLPRRTSWPN